MSALLGRRVDFTNESLFGAGGQYMSFERGSRGGSRAISGSKGPGPTKEVSLDLVYCFYGRKNYLSNFFEAPMNIAGHVYPTVEHYYEACKVYALAGPYQAMYLKGCPDCGQVKTMSKRIIQEAGKPRKEVEKWKRSDGLLVIRVRSVEVLIWRYYQSNVGLYIVLGQFFN